MLQELNMRIILQQPNEGVWFGVQKGSGNHYEVMLLQEATGNDLQFGFNIGIRMGKEGELDFGGPLVQGPRGGRFIYIDIGTCAGQKNSLWTRRLKIPLAGISFDTLKEVEKINGLLETHVPGKGKDGGPNCATVKPFGGWKLAKQ
jgi:hypothetical protein